jgi:hypothetical protein
VDHHSPGVYASLERRSNDKKSLKIKMLEAAFGPLARPVIKKDAVDRSRVANITA